MSLRGKRGAAQALAAFVLPAQSDNPERARSAVLSDAESTLSALSAADRDTALWALSELLENAERFAFGRAVTGSVWREVAGHLAVVITNQVPVAEGEAVARRLEEVTGGEPFERLVAQAERNARRPEPSASGLGLLSLRADHGVIVVYQLSPVPDEPGWVLVEVEATWQVDQPERRSGNPAF